MPMSSSGTCSPWCANPRSLPPEKPVQPNVVNPWLFAQSTARRMFGLFPLPLIATSKSPGDARFFNCSTNTRSKPSSLPHAKMYGVLSVRLSTFRRFFVSSSKNFRASVPFPMSSQKWDALEPEPPLPITNTNRPATYRSWIRSESF